MEIQQILINRESPPRHLSSSETVFPRVPAGLNTVGFRFCTFVVSQQSKASGTMRALLRNDILLIGIRLTSLLKV